MSESPAQRLAELGITLPKAPLPVANYLPYVIDEAAGLLHISGQLPIRDGRIAHTGLLGADVSIADGVSAARLCAVNGIAQISAACGDDLGRVERILRIGVFVASTPDFTDQPSVANGASDLIGEVFGVLGRHARSAVGVAALPKGASVEVEFLVKIRA